VFHFSVLVLVPVLVNEIPSVSLHPTRAVMENEHETITESGDRPCSKDPLTTWLRFEHEPRKVRAVRFFSYANIEHEHESDGKGTQILVLVLVSYGRPISRKTRTFAVSRTSTSTSTEKRNTP